MVLPVTLVHHDLEAPIDFVARLATANGFSSLRDFLAHTEIGVRAIIAGDVDALAVVAEWSGVPAARLARWAVAGNGPGGTWRMGYATFSKDMRPGRKMRFCAQCVLADREREPGRMAARAYRRAWWSVNGIERCLAHKCALTEVCVAADGDVHDFPQFVKTNLGMIEDGAACLPSEITSCTFRKLFFTDMAVIPIKHDRTIRLNTDGFYFYASLFDGLDSAGNRVRCEGNGSSTHDGSFSPYFGLVSRERDISNGCPLMRAGREECS